MPYHLIWKNATSTKDYSASKMWLQQWFWGWMTSCWGGRFANLGDKSLDKKPQNLVDNRTRSLHLPVARVTQKKQDWQCLDLSVGMVVVQKRRKAVPLVVGAQFFLSKIHGHFLELRVGSEEVWGRILERIPHLLSWHLGLPIWELPGDTKNTRAVTEKEAVCKRRCVFSVKGKV